MFDYIRLAPGFVREVLDAYENWNGKDSVPMKIQELNAEISAELVAMRPGRKLGNEAMTPI